ncbi:MAG TPA: hypothetical protein DCL21_04500 [Alphaproteobacteria bacterium]|nr:hypothetical protein [Alphaproteobacteria bacterium]
MTKQAKKQTKIDKKFELKALRANNKKIILTLVATTALVSVFVIYSTIKEDNTEQTRINTPVIARTELSKKPAIEIKVFDENSQQAEITIAEPKETEASATEQPETTQTTGKTAELSEVIKNLTALELEQVELKEQVNKLDAETNAEVIADLKARMTKLESLNGNIGNMSKIFLAQQLVLLDNAFKVGGNQNLAIENIHNFAKNVAKDEKVALKLQELLTLTQQQAIITPQALLFYAEKLEGVELIKLEDQKAELAKDASIVEKVKAFLKSFIIIRKQDEVTAEQQTWNNSIKALQEAIIFTDFVTVEKILADKNLQELGQNDFSNFAKLFTTYLKQQQALQATLGAFIEGYNYDY